MKKPEIFNKIDKSILKKHPFQWIIGWHIFLPIIVGLILLAAALAFLTPTKIFSYSDDDSLKVSSVFVGFISFMAFILYVIRQIKFNSFRIHHHIPYAKSILIFFSFWLIIFLFSVIPFIPDQVYTLRVRSEINSITDNFEKDLETFCNTSPFFFSSRENCNIKVLLAPFKEILHDKNDTLTLKDVCKSAVHKPLGINSNSTYYEIYSYLDLNFEDDNILINRLPLNYFDRSVTNPLPIKIRKKKAITHIENFTKVAKKYDIKLVIDNPEEIYKRRKTFNKQTEIKHFSLFSSTNKSEIDYDRDIEYEYMMSSYQEQMNKQFNFVLLFVLLIFSILLATLLWVYISVPLPDFGFSILAIVLIMIFMGIVVAILSIFNISHQDEIRIVFFIAIFLIYLIAFLGKSKKLIIRILKIICHYLVPVFLFLVILEIDDANYFEDEIYYFISLFIVGMIISVFIFKEIYKKSKLLPK